LDAGLDAWKNSKIFMHEGLKAFGPEQRPGAEQCNCEADKYLPHEYQQATRHDVPSAKLSSPHIGQQTAYIHSI